MPKKIPMRQCTGCREMKAKRELIRVVKSPDYTAEDERRLEQAIGGYLTDRIGWKIVYVERLRRNKNGKVKFIISEL